ncbi:hypothetical protein CBR_g30153 [Chara braunii]|uniref:Uncharacterized protein n=1 Tax=Chara braunii TaxID=69332 RepID=A0A388LC58_CHABU|nr:hypothetical protein CBR_g30153 [Chara braunii]|eukprot:GBG79888.1 hypothetical protein CBR_g30153 [Chara braunii]
MPLMVLTGKMSRRKAGAHGGTEMKFHHSKGHGWNCGSAHVPRYGYVLTLLSHAIGNGQGSSSGTEGSCIYCTEGSCIYCTEGSSTYRTEGSCTYRTEGGCT